MRTPRHRSREFALQALYQYWVNPGQSLENLLDNIKETAPFLSALADKKPRVDEAFFETLVQGVYREEAHYAAVLSPYLDRDWLEVNWVERAVLALATYELHHCLSTPSAVIINEAVELSKAYGKEESYRFINGVLDKLIPSLRPNEKRDRSPVEAVTQDIQADDIGSLLES